MAKAQDLNYILVEIACQPWLCQQAPSTCETKSRCQPAQKLSLNIVKYYIHCFETGHIHVVSIA